MRFIDKGLLVMLATGLFSICVLSSCGPVSPSVEKRALLGGNGNISPPSGPNSQEPPSQDQGGSPGSLIDPEAEILSAEEFDLYKLNLATEEPLPVRQKDVWEFKENGAVTLELGKSEPSKIILVLNSSLSVIREAESLSQKDIESISLVLRRTSAVGTKWELKLKDGIPPRLREVLLSESLAIHLIVTK